MSISLDDGSSIELGGDFYFDRAGDVIRLAMEKVEARVQANGNEAILSEGHGALVVNPSGVAGIFEGVISAQLGDDMGADSKVFVRTNNTGGVVDEVIRIGEREVSINFGSDEGDVFLVTLDGFSLNIGNIVTIEGSFSFVSRDGLQVAAAKDATVFVGLGPAYLVDGTVNSEAVGVLVRGATIGIVKKVEEDGTTLYAIDAKGDLEAIGVKDAKMIGTASVRVNMLGEGVDQTIRFPGEDDNVKVIYSGTEVAQGDDYYSSIVASGIQIEVLGQKLTGDVEIAPYELGDDRGVKVTLAKGLAMFGPEGNEVLVIENLKGDLTFLNQQASAVFSGDLQFKVPNISAGGSFNLSLDTAQDKVELSGTESVYFEVAGQRLEGQFVFEKNELPL
jgi:hypothetical protein